MYGAVLVAATLGGFAMGAAQDYNAHRLLARALDYEGDRVGVSPDFGGGTPVSLAGLDPEAVRSQMSDAPFTPAGAPALDATGAPTRAVPGGSAPGPTALAPPGSGTPAGSTPAGPAPAPTGGGGGGTPPPQPGSHPPTPSPSPPAACNPQKGSGSYNGRVTDAKSGQGVTGVTVTFYLNGCPVARGVTRNGKVDRFSAFLPNTTYTYRAAGGGYRTAYGSVRSGSSGEVNTGIVVSK